MTKHTFDNEIEDAIQQYQKKVRKIDIEKILFGLIYTRTNIINKIRKFS